jgi:hypothetical protein
MLVRWTGQHPQAQIYPIPSELPRIRVMIFVRHPI